MYIGEYSLTLNDLNGCSVESQALLKPLNGGCVDIPSGFTPNGDGHNDAWNILGGVPDNLQKLSTLYPRAIVEVYNRWGILVYQSAPGYPEDWDGTANGKEVPVNSYYYIIDLYNGSKPIIGNITILR